MRRELTVFTLIVASLSVAQQAQANLRPYYFLPWEAAMSGVPGSRVVTVGNSQGRHTGDDEFAWDFGGNDWQVRAARTGTVVAFRDTKDPGNPTCNSSLSGQANYVRILHSDGDETLYTHLKKCSVSALGVTVGQTVVRHTIIGRTDSTGYVCGAHLHYQVQEHCATPPTITTGFCNSLASSFLDENVVAQNPSDGVPQTDQTVISENLYQFELNPPWVPQGWANFFGRGEPGGDLTSGVDTASWGEGHVIAFARDSNQQLVYRQRLSTQDWGAWISLGAPTGLYLVGGPAAVSWAPNRIDVFARGSDNNLWHRVWNGIWNGWEPLGSPEGGLTSDPDVASWGVNRLDVVARGQDDALYNLVWNGSWSAWGYLGGSLSSAPSAVSWGPNRIDVFVRGIYPSYHLYHRVYIYGSGWFGWENLCDTPYPNCYLTSAPDASSWLTNRIDVFVQGSNNHLSHRVYASGWAGFENLCASPYPTCFMNADPGAVSWGYGRIDAFVRGSGNNMYQRRYGL
jgi:murein DD-endopeptidase MepM/ murein hydrolase activator NlpD